MKNKDVSEKRNFFDRYCVTNSKQSGLSVLEIVIVVGITSVIMTILVRFIVVGYPLSQTMYLQARSTETARLQLKRMVKILREARQSDTGSYPLAEIGPQKIVFFADVSDCSFSEDCQDMYFDSDARRLHIQD